MKLRWLMLDDEVDNGKGIKVYETWLMLSSRGWHVEWWITIHLVVFIRTLSILLSMYSVLNKWNTNGSAELKKTQTTSSSAFSFVITCQLQL